MYLTFLFLFAQTVQGDDISVVTDKDGGWTIIGATGPAPTHPAPTPAPHPTPAPAPHPTPAPHTQHPAPSSPRQQRVAYEQWTVEQVGEWLQREGLSTLVDVFARTALTAALEAMQRGSGWDAGATGVPLGPRLTCGMCVG